jgi:hypothetical protein
MGFIEAIALLGGWIFFLEIEGGVKRAIQAGLYLSRKGSLAPGERWKYLDVVVLICEYAPACRHTAKIDAIVRIGY